MSLDELPVDEISVDVNISGQKCLWTNLPCTKFPWTKMSLDENVSGRNFRGQKCIWTKFPCTKFPWPKMSLDENVSGRTFRGPNIQDEISTDDFTSIRCISNRASPEEPSEKLYALTPLFSMSLIRSSVKGRYIGVHTVEDTSYY